MINWFNMPSEGLSNGGQFEIKELSVTENGEYEKDGEVYSKVTVNVSGGGGSSDFSTASVVVTNNLEENPLVIDDLVNADVDGLSNGVALETGESKTISVVLYKDIPTYGFLHRLGIVAVTGDIVYENGDIYVSGAGTITVTDDK